MGSTTYQLVQLDFPGFLVQAHDAFQAAARPLYSAAPLRIGVESWVSVPEIVVSLFGVVICR